MKPAAQLAASVLKRCAALAACTDEPGQTLRTFLSPAMEECHKLVRAWMTEAGMTVHVDEAGNLRGLLALQPNLPRVILASHLDTVPNAGAYDGILGVLLGIALVEAVEADKLNIAIEVIGFSDEEGVRYGIPFIGSRAIAHTLDYRTLHQTDAAQISIAQALTQFRAAHPEAIPADIHPNTCAYLEFHIEQGPVLDEQERPLAVVDAIAGQSRLTCIFHGKAAHAGTTPMHMRQDALAAAAEWISYVEATATTWTGLVATVGQIDCQPGASNVIPAIVKCSLDLRHASDAEREAALHEMEQQARHIARKRNVHFEIKKHHDQPATPMDSNLTRLAALAIEQAGYPAPHLTSGAGHDAMILAPHVPSTMIFLRTPDGLSHHPDESVREEDVQAAIEAGIVFLKLFQAEMKDHRIA